MTDEEIRKLAEYAEKHDITMSDAIRNGLAITQFFDELEWKDF